ncbi:hypothetical protein SprV_0100435400 [Sparganum proliferum]
MVSSFHALLNSVLLDIQFTLETENNNVIVFIDVLVHRKVNGNLKTTVYRKATNTRQVPYHHSNHPLRHKRSCVRSLYKRVDTLCSELADKFLRSKLRWRNREKIADPHGRARKSGTKNGSALAGGGSLRSFWPCLRLPRRRSLGSRVRETLEAWHTTTTSINRCVTLPAAYQALWVTFNKQGYRRGVRPEAAAVKPRPSGSTDENRPASETDDNRGQPAANANPGDRLLGPNTNRREHSNASVENRCCQLRDTVQSTALALLGRARRLHQDWFDNNDAVIGNLLAEKNHLHKAYADHPTDDNRAAFYRSRRNLQQRLREMQDAWTARKAEEIQGYADRNEWKKFFCAIKPVYGPPTKGTAPILSADGSVLKRPSTISHAAIARLPQVETNVDLDLSPSLQETIRAVQQLSSGKAPGSDLIPAEVYKHGGPQLMDHLTALFQEMWRQGEVPQDFKDATIVHLYKRKGNRQLCDKHRGISLLNIAGKIFARILLNRLNNYLEQGLLPESHCSFRRHRGTTEIIFVAHQLQEKCQEMRTHLCSTFVDLKNAVDTVNRDEL